MSEIIETIEIPEHWVCDSDGKAMWACNVIKEIRDKRDFMVDWYKQQIKKVEEQADFDTLRLEKHLEMYFSKVPHKKANKSESYTFPGGKLVLKHQDPEYKRDEQTVIEWLKKNDGAQFVKTKEELAWKELKEASSGVVDGKIILREEINEDGEIIQIPVPGIEVVEREDKFCVEVK